MKQVRTLRWTAEADLRVNLGFASRRLTGAVGQKLKEKAKLGMLRLLDKKPRYSTGHMQLMAAPDGVVVLYYESCWKGPLAEFVGMCPTFRRKLGLNRRGSIRWMKVIEGR